MTGGAREFEPMPTPVHTTITLYNNLLIRMQLMMRMIIKSTRDWVKF